MQQKSSLFTYTAGPQLSEFGQRSAKGHAPFSEITSMFRSVESPTDVPWYEETLMIILRGKLLYFWVLMGEQVCWNSGVLETHWTFTSAWTE